MGHSSLNRRQRRCLHTKTFHGAGQCLRCSAMPQDIIEHWRGLVKKLRVWESKAFQTNQSGDSAPVKCFRVTCDGYDDSYVNTTTSSKAKFQVFFRAKETGVTVTFAALHAYRFPPGDKWAKWSSLKWRTPRACGLSVVIEEERQIPSAAVTGIPEMGG